MVRALHADQGFFVRVVLLDALLEEAVEDVSKCLHLINALHLVQPFILLDLARICAADKVPDLCAAHGASATLNHRS